MSGSSGSGCSPRIDLALQHPVDLAGLVDDALHGAPGPRRGLREEGVVRAPGLRRDVDARVLGPVGRHRLLQPPRGPLLAGTLADERGRLLVGPASERAQQAVELGPHPGGEAAKVGGRIEREGGRRRRGRGAGRGRRGLAGAHALPLVDEARVHATHGGAQEGHHVLQGLVAVGPGHGLDQRLVGLGEVAQEHPLAPLQLVLPDVVVERHGPLDHLPGHRLGPDVLLAHPGVERREGVEGRVDELGVGLRVLDVLELRHPLVVLLALGLHARDRLAAGPVELLPEHHVGVLEDRLHLGQHVEGVGLPLRVDAREAVEQVEREGVEEREVVLQAAGGPDVAPRVALHRVQLEEAGGPQRPEPLRRQPAVARPRVVVPVGARPPARRAARSLRPRRPVSPWRRLSSSPKVTSKRLSSGSGALTWSRSKVSRSQGTYPFCGGFFFSTFLPAACFSAIRLFSTTCSGAWATT